jgi:hypothetical protein
MTNSYGLINRAKWIYQKEGLLALLKNGLAFLGLYEKSYFYVFRRNIISQREADFKPVIDNMESKIVTSTHELNELVNSGYLFSTDFKDTKRKLGKGAVGILIFINRELAYSGWTALSAKAKTAFNPQNYRGNFSNNEASSGGDKTNLKYRNLGLFTYGAYLKRRYLFEHGIKTNRGIILTDNAPSIKVLKTKTGFNENDKVYAKARYLKILGVKFWRETPLDKL